MAKKVKRPAQKTAKAKKSGKLEGEGSYTASRNYDRGTEKFIARNKGKIAKMAKDAEKALEGPEGKSLRAAEKAGRARARR
jgi:ribosome-interacting GTPase 1